MRYDEAIYLITVEIALPLQGSLRNNHGSKPMTLMPNTLFFPLT